MEIKAAQCQNKQNTVTSDRNLVLTYCNKNWKPTKVIAGQLCDPKNNPFVTSYRHRTQGLHHPPEDHLPAAPWHYDQKVRLDIFGTCTLDANMDPPTWSFGRKASCPGKREGAGKGVRRPLCSGDRAGSGTAQTGETTEDKGGERRISALVPGLAWEGWPTWDALRSQK